MIKLPAELGPKGGSAKACPSARRIHIWASGCAAGPRALGRFLLTTNICGLGTEACTSVDTTYKYNCEFI